MISKNRIAVFDLGGQYTHLITKKIYKLGVDSYVIHDLTEPKIRPDTKGIIFSGGPNSVYDKDSPKIPPSVFQSGLPILGICYGHQAVVQSLGGKVSRGEVKEYGVASLEIKTSDTLFVGLKRFQKVWMSHGDNVTQLPPGFDVLASTADCKFTAIGNLDEKIFGVQFHPEVTHTTNGSKMFNNFLFKICKCSLRQNHASEVPILLREIKNQTKDKRVFFFVSGGVDSAVAFSLCIKALGKNKVKGVCLDTGFMRKNELAKVRNAFKKCGMTNIDYLDESTNFVNALKNVHSPERKREIIGTKFIEIQNNYMKSHYINGDDWLLGQGTIYPDTIESGGTKHSSVIKTHHNRVGAVERLKIAGKLLEPVIDYYKDEVRVLGRQLSLPSEIIEKDPFPGPGLAIRCLTSPRSSALISRPSMEKSFLGKDFSIKSLTIKSVGVQGDRRSESNVLVIEGKLHFKELESVSTSIINKHIKVNRVTYLLKAKGALANAHIVKCNITKERLDLLRQADFTVNRFIKNHKIVKKIWQFPVILLPLQFTEGETIALRPVSSINGMTAEFTKLPRKVAYELAEQLLDIKGIDGVLYDITNKPPATVEWE